MSKATAAARAAEMSTDFVTILIAGQTFGIPIEQVQDVFVPQSVTHVPLAPNEVAGILNLRGRIVTAIDVRARLGLPPASQQDSSMAVGIEHRGESYGLIIDNVGEVLSLPVADFEANPANLDDRWCSVSNGIYRLNGTLMVVLNVEKLLDIGRRAA